MCLQLKRIVGVLPQTRCVCFILLCCRSYLFLKNAFRKEMTTAHSHNTVTDFSSLRLLEHASFDFSGVPTAVEFADINDDGIPELICCTTESVLVFNWQSSGPACVGIGLETIVSLWPSKLHGSPKVCSPAPFRKTSTLILDTCCYCNSRRSYACV